MSGGMTSPDPQPATPVVPDGLTIAAAGTAPDDTGQASPAAPERSREHAAASLRERAEAAEAKLAGIRAVLLEGGQDHGTVRRRAIGLIGTEEKGGGPDDRSFMDPAL